MFAKPSGRYQTFRANSKISYKAGYRHSSPPLGKETAGAGPLFLAVATATGRHDYRIQDIHGSRRCWSEPVFFSLPVVAALQGTPRYEPPSEGKASFFDEGCEYWIKITASAVSAPSVNIFKKTLAKIVDSSHCPSFQLTEISSPNPLIIPPHQTACHSLVVPISIFCPDPYFVYVVSPGTFRPNSYHSK